ncbi:hypothetical protein TVAG_055050 [Trichomonas vaginalis G3]|uniref:Ubiquitin fusion degradation protein n=1 Tax=Trichomonas vaginalis (strain ATCC PRA-98 / G3) TaxID=412133 RepID=A2ETH3_TRIV3|nr:hypothetical protein TVAG_055050 [Trichomonas vaginalis G3]|eukprot:XP_001316242.1 hypothetical protein [Trichomonas vaginalis G3]
MSFRSTFLVVFPETVGRKELNETGKIILPSTIIAKLRNETLMQFLLKNPLTQKTIGAGVEEFSSEEPSCVVPRWMCENLGLTENDKIVVQFQKFPKIKELIFQPSDNESANILNEKQIIMEYTLRSYPVLTQGSILVINFANKMFFLKVLFTKPERIVNTLSSNPTVTFSRPLMEFSHNWGEEEDEEEIRKSKQKDPFSGVAKSIRQTSKHDHH